MTSLRQLEIVDFINELTALTNKYQISISGCGCCGSPYLTDLNNGEYIMDDLFYNEKDKSYDTPNILF